MADETETKTRITFDKKTIIIIALAVLLSISSYYSITVYINQEINKAYLNGASDGATVINNNMITQLVQNGFLTISVNTTDGMKTIKLVPEVVK